VKRRRFLQGALTAAGATCTPVLFRGDRAARAATAGSRTADGRIDVLLNEPIGRVAPEIYGHFVEHLGATVYGGVWVGERSKVPNLGGIRKSLVEALRRLKPPVIRWPGGCFADSYDWRDGVGPRARRPRHTSFWGGASEWPKPPAGPSKYENNAFGTNEFVRFCRLVGAQPYLAVNVRSGSPRDFMDWVEYCNGPPGSTTPADLRVASGERAPFGVRTWGVGNEPWGCGGNFTPEEYASEFRRFIEWVPDGGALSFVAAGSSDDDLDWTRRFLAKIAERHGIGRIWGYSLHHYAWNVSGGRTTDWTKGKGDAVNYPDEEWYELLREADRTESFIADHWKAMAAFDPEHKIKLVVDEWGAWYRPGSQVDDTHLLGQQSTMRDAVLAGLTLDTFNRHADKVAMANVAQLVNCLQSPFLARGDKLILTPTFHVFEMYAPHQGAQSLRTVFASPGPSYTRNGQPATMRGLSGSASRRDKQLVLTVTNPDLRQPRATEIVLVGGSRAAAAVRCTTLAAGDVHAVNTFEEPERVHPQQTTLAENGGSLVHEFPAASVTRLELTLA
jgi:alpha-N-arabinofuranosidase